MKTCTRIGTIIIILTALFILAGCGGEDSAEKDTSRQKTAARAQPVEPKIKADWVGRWKVVSCEGEKLDGTEGTVYALNDDGTIKVGGFKRGAYEQKEDGRVVIQFEGYGEKPFEADIHKEGDNLVMTKYAPDDPTKVSQTLNMVAYQ